MPISDPWFQVYRVSAGVFAIYEPYQFQEVISYLIVGSEQAIVFDTGMGIGRLRSVVSELTSLPLRVINSHTHSDHVGGNADFETVLGMDTEFTRHSAEGLPHEAVQGEVAPEALCRPLPEGVTAQSYRSRPFKISGLLEDGDVLELGGRSLEVLSVPGHTPDAIALLDRAAGLLWTGDTFYEGPIWLLAPETDFEAYVASVERLAKLVPELRLLLPAHNTPVAEPRRLEQLKTAVAAIRAGDSESACRSPRVESSTSSRGSRCCSSQPRANGRAGRDAIVARVKRDLGALTGARARRARDRRRDSRRLRGAGTPRSAGSRPRSSRPRTSARAPHGTA